MMLIPRLALRNLLGAGLRTWLNVIVLSLSFFVIIWTQGIYKGMGERAADAMTEVELGGGQYWHENYDPYDPLTLQEAHGKVTGQLKALVDKGLASPVLVIQGTIYPGGRMRNVLLKGIDPSQKIVSLPSRFLQVEGEELPVLIGGRMAKNTGLKKGDSTTLRWRDINGTFDAIDAKIIQVMRTSVQTVDTGQLWLPLKRLQEMTGMSGEATLVVVDQNYESPGVITGWVFKNLDFLLSDLRAMVQSKKVGATFLYVLLLFFAMLAIFNTQVLSIFRRRKEMGTLMAIGLARSKIIQLFTLEGAMHAVLAAVLAAVYGFPLLWYFAVKGWAMPEVVDTMGFALGEKLYSTYSAGLVVGTTFLVLLVTTIVSFLPTRKIAKLKPTDALRGKLS
jgi:ABC-type lipoprotein release transport system permease subunit